MDKRHPRGEAIDYLAGETSPPAPLHFGEGGKSMSAVAEAMLSKMQAEERGRLGLTFAEGMITARTFRLTSVGLVIDEGIGPEEWEDIGDLLFTAVPRAWNLWVGDWLALGERRWGATYQQVAELTGYDVHTLYTLVWVCSRVEISLRRENLDLGHYKLVAGMSHEDQRRFLVYASEHELSVEALRGAIREALTPGPSPSGRGEIAPMAMFERLYKGFATKLLEFAGGVGRDERAQMAGKLRELAEKIEGI